MATNSPDLSLADETEKPSAVLDDERAAAEKGDGVTEHRRHDPNWTGDDVDFSGVDEKKVLRKMDLRLIPMLAVLYLLSFLDRGACLGIFLRVWAGSGERR
jgi:hypothetical protein